MAQVCRLGSKVGSRLALFCTHRVNRVNSRNDSESCCQCHKHCPGSVFIISDRQLYAECAMPSPVRLTVYLSVSLSVTRVDQ